MDIRQLRYLIALAREGHFTRAAETCFVTQPTLSARIRQLEEELGVPLVLRGQRYHGLTPEGERVLGWARRIVEDVDGMRRDLSALSGEPEGRMTLGVIPTAMPCLPRLTEALRLRYPRIGFEILSQTSRQIARGLEDFSIDAGLTYLDGEPLGIGTTWPLFAEHYRLFVAADSVLARRAEITWAEAADLPLCAMTPDMQNRRILDAAFATAERTPRPMVESNSMLALCAHVAHGGYATILPAHFAAIFGEGGRVRSIPLVSPALTRTIGIVALERDPPPPLIAALIETAKALGGIAGLTSATE